MEKRPSYKCPNCRNIMQVDLYVKDGGSMICSLCDKAFHKGDDCLHIGFIHECYGLKTCKDIEVACPECNMKHKNIINNYYSCPFCETKHFT